MLQKPQTNNKVFFFLPRSCVDFNNVNLKTIFNFFFDLIPQYVGWIGLRAL